MKKLIKRLNQDQIGATAIEYGLIAALIAIAVIVGAMFVGQNLSSTFNTIAVSIKNLF